MYLFLNQSRRRRGPGLMRSTPQQCRDAVGYGLAYLSFPISYALFSLQYATRVNDTWCVSVHTRRGPTIK